MSKSPKFRASRHLAARILLNRDDIVVHNDGTVTCGRKIDGNQQFNIGISALVILEHLGESVPEFDERIFRDVRADKRTNRIASQMRMRLMLDSSVLDREWPSLLKHYEADAPLQSTADTHA